jgi:lipopolysaccharide/colanic/teichoic acid biosynthesis glycosyltransferase
MKRLFDITVALIGLSLLAIPFGCIALAIKLSSSGPVFFRQKRVGRRGQPFWLYKFRSMRVENSGPQITAEGDPRITWIGALLRRTKLDELPQLWNVLRGDMSVIGPRPEVERFVRYYTASQRQVLESRPGLAGVAQLAYQHEADLLRGRLDPEEAYIRYFLPAKVAVDLEYERTRTFWTDLKLMAEIVLAIAGFNRRLDHNFRLPAVEEKTPVAVR